MERHTSTPAGTVTAPVACTSCGTRAPDDGTWRLTWTSGIERGRTVWACDRCSRDNLRSIEAKLDSAWGDGARPAGVGVRPLLRGHPAQHRGEAGQRLVVSGFRPRPGG